MTLTLLGSIISYLLPFAGRLFGIFEKREEHRRNLENDRLDHERELELGRLQVEAAKVKGAHQVEAVGIEAAADSRAEAHRSYRAESKAPMSGWVHDVRGMVRPAVTAAVAFVFLWKEFHGQAHSPEFVGIAVAVVLFWFGGRDVMHLSGKGVGRIAGSWNRLRQAWGK